MQVKPPTVQPPLLSGDDSEDRRRRAGWEAEQCLHEALSSWNAGPDSVAVCNCKLRHGHRINRREKAGEADFLLVLDEGVFILEVKAHARLDFEKDPFDQAEGNRREVKAYFESELPQFFNRTVFGWGVVVPNLDSRDFRDTISHPAAVICGHNDLGGDFSGWMKRFVSHWRDVHERSTSRRPEDLRGITREIAERFAPAGPIVQSLAIRDEKLRQRQTELSEKQAILYSWLMNNKQRIICEGGAGTGKTVLACEAARVHAEAGRSVFLTTRSKNLARWLRNRMKDVEGDIVVEQFSRAADEVKARRNPFDALVIDEGQDLLLDENESTLEALLVGGIEEGSWWLAADFNNQAGFYGAWSTRLYERFRSAAQEEPVVLDENLRNTSEIATEVSRWTGADVGRPTDEIRGPDPAVHTLETGDGIETGVRLEEIVRGLIEDDRIREREIVVVGNADLIGELRDGASEGYVSRLSRLKAKDLDTWNQGCSRGLVFASPEMIKGLEARAIVVVVDTSWDDLDEAAFRSWSYVSLSRATGVLHILGTRTAIDRIKAMAGATGAAHAD